MAENSLAQKPDPDWQKRSIIPDGPVTGLKRVLFVCVGGHGASGVGMDLFKEATKGEHLSMAIEMDSAGTHDPVVLRKKLSKADFVVPMSSTLVPEIEKAMLGLGKKPRMLNPRFTFGTIGNKARYKVLFRRVTGARRRPSARRPF